MWFPVAVRWFPLTTPSIPSYLTSNVTGRHRGPRSEAKASGWLQSTVTTTHVLSMHCCLMLCMSYFSLLSVVSALYVYSTFRHHPHPLGHLCAKFRSFGCRHCWASPCRKIAYSINQSLSDSLTHPPSLFDAPGTEKVTTAADLQSCADVRLP